MIPLSVKGPERRAQRTWTVEETVKLITLRQDGFSDHDIAEHLQRSVKSVRQRRYNIHNNGESNMKKLSNEKMGWSGKDIQTVLDLHNQGVSDHDIGEKLGRSTKAVQIKRGNITRAARPKAGSRETLAKELEPGLNALFGTEYDFDPVLPKLKVTSIRDEEPPQPRKKVEPLSPKKLALSLTPTPTPTKNYFEIQIPKKAVYGAIIAVVALLAWAAGHYG